MPGLYIHIPFCRKACHYCNFHFSTTLSRQDELVSSLVKEIGLRKDYLADKKLDSIYFGGGTPSLLTDMQLATIFEAIYSHFTVQPGAEITLEANPDDLGTDKLLSLKRSPVNRLSIGVQSFSDEDLHWMNRVHSANQAEEVIRNAQQAGFSNLTIDLIYGVPGLTDERWKKNLEKAVGLGVTHISSYCLTVEQKTALQHLIDTGKYKKPDEEQGARQFEILIETLKQAGFEQYEISNFASGKKYAVHNSNYWKGKHYLGIGPSAHSFNGKSRSWNIANNAAYIDAIARGEPSVETELLSETDRFNEYIMTGLRTSWGCSLAYLELHFPELLKKAWPAIEDKINAGLMRTEENSLKLTEAGKLLADGIASDLFA